MSSFFARISRVGRYTEYVPCLHEQMRRISYDEAQDVRGTSALRGPEWNGDRERGMRSITSLLMRSAESESWHGRRKYEFISFF